MKYRTKLYLAFGVTWLIIAGGGRAWYYFEVKYILKEEQRKKVEALAATIAPMISGDELVLLQNKEDVKRPEFKRLAHFLSKVSKANRRSDVDVDSIYIIRPWPADPTQVEITIDIENPPHTDTYFIRNEVWPQATSAGLLKHIDERWATRKFYTDQWGTWLTGVAPIYDSKNNYVATLAVDLTAASVQHAMNHLLLIATLTGFISLGAGLLLAALMAYIATRSLNRITHAVEEIGHGNLKAPLEISSKDEFGKLAQAIRNMQRGLEENARLKTNFIRYVSKHIMEKILTSDISITLKGERRKITVLFSDIRKFTTLAEKLPPEEVVSLLNEYLEKMLNVIFDYQGTLDKFLGDGIMVEFGAPLEDVEQEKHAVKTAIEMQRALQELNSRWSKVRKIHLEMGIGIHTGHAVVGNIGTDKRMDYTAIGDTVNTASMLEQESKQQKSKILISETTVSPIRNQFKFKSLGSLKLPGRTSTIEAFTIEE